MTALYIGASWDIRFLKILDNKNFIHIDPSPNSKGTGYGDKIFIDKLVNKLKKVNYYLTSESYNKLKDLGENKLALEFKNEEDEKNIKTLKYYVNTWFPEDIDKIKNLKKNIEEIDTLIISGFNPSEKIISLIKNPINLVLDDNTYYGNQTDGCEDKENSLINYLHKNKNSTCIKSIILYHKVYEPFKCNNIQDAENKRQKL